MNIIIASAAKIFLFRIQIDIESYSKSKLYSVAHPYLLMYDTLQDSIHFARQDFQFIIFYIKIINSA